MELEIVINDVSLNIDGSLQEVQAVLKQLGCTTEEIQEHTEDKELQELRPNHKTKELPEDIDDYYVVLTKDNERANGMLVKYHDFHIESQETLVESSTGERKWVKNEDLIPFGDCNADHYKEIKNFLYFKDNKNEAYRYLQVGDYGDLSEEITLTGLGNITSLKEDEILTSGIKVSGKNALGHISDSFLIDLKKFKKVVED